MPKVTQQKFEHQIWSDFKASAFSTYHLCTSVSHYMLGFLKKRQTKRPKKKNWYAATVKALEQCSVRKNLGGLSKCGNPTLMRKPACCHKVKRNRSFLRWTGIQLQWSRPTEISGKWSNEAQSCQRQLGLFRVKSECESKMKIRLKSQWWWPQSWKLPPWDGQPDVCAWGEFIYTVSTTGEQLCQSMASKHVLWGCCMN